LISGARAEDSNGAARGSRRIKVLFLGDDGHHRPLDRCRQVFVEMARRGIDFTYTDRMEDLNPATLGRYDALLVYANTTQISPAQEKAVLDYVAAGHGYVPIHCASYCFLNSKPMTELTGARFKTHGTGTFKETYVAPDHELLKDLKPIESWDETYVHEMHNEKDRTVLSVRADEKGKEPYTWVRTNGKGRVFYTAWGHDQRTWGSADFLNLLERGIRWSVGPDALLARHEAKAPFEYENAPAPIPNYPPSERWGTTGENFKTMQKPLTPEASMKRLVLPPGFEAQLFASEPQVRKPICMAFDERGRLWVSETVDYPNNMQRQGEGHDQITICEDTDGDGKADKFTLFADKLSIPTSIVRANGGLIVTQAPHVLFLKDTNGDGTADERKILFTGFGISDTHAGPSNLRWGFDNWIYGTCGYSGFRGEVGGKRVTFGQGLFRFKPDGSQLEFLGSSNNNTWGLGLTEDAQVVASTANANPSFYLHIPNRYYESVRGMAARVLGPMADTYRFYPLTQKVRQVDQHGGYTAGADHAVYTARTYPREYWNRIAFVAEPTGHLVGQFVLQRKGSDFASQNNFNFLSSDDEWTAPISAEVGPDGQVWVIDWYNYIVQHNPIPRGFEKGKGNAYETPLRDKRHGRVYRIVFKDGKPSQTYQLDKATPAELVGVLKSDNMLWRMHAQRLLVERGDQSVAGALAELVSDTRVDETGQNPTAVHALWTLHGLGADTWAAASAGLKHPAAGVRKAAVDVMPRDEQGLEAILGGNALADQDAQVRKSALLAISEMPPSDKAGSAIFTVLGKKQNSDDRWIPDAAVIAGARHDAGFLRAAFAAYKADPADANAATLDTSNKLPNPSFEDGRDSQPTGWSPRTYGGQATFTWVPEGRNGGKCLKVVSTEGADAGWLASLQVEPNATYRLSGWVKAQRLTAQSGMGALMNVHEIQSVRTNAVRGGGDWQKVEAIFNTGNRRTIGINCLFGGWGTATGTALFDDVELVRVPDNSLPGPVGKAISAVANHYAQRGPVESIGGTLVALRTASPVLAQVMIEGMASGWPAASKPTFNDRETSELRALIKSLPATTRDRMFVLADKWGQKGLVAEEMKAAAGELRAAVGDAQTDAAKRIDAARRLVAIDDSPASVEEIVKQINPQAAPELQVGLIEALTLSREDSAGRSIVSRWTTLTPSAQRAAVALLLRKANWTPALLDGVESGKVNPKDLMTEHWQMLSVNRDPAVAERAKKLQASAGRAPNADKKKLIEALLPQVSGTGDLAKGKEVFAKNCQVCHTIEGQGGQVGPDLTGIGARPRADILAEIVDPNRSVEGTFRQWTLETREEDEIMGRLISESQTSVELIDATGQKHAVQRKDIKNLTASERSVMPEGFDQSMSKEDLTNLLEFIGSSKVKH
jgi:putative membrane-bound dehydrogenase-like protein